MKASGEKAQGENRTRKLEAANADLCLIERSLFHLLFFSFRGRNRDLQGRLERAALMRCFYWPLLVFPRLVGEKWLHRLGGHQHRMHYGSGKMKEFRKKRAKQEGTI